MEDHSKPYHRDPTARWYWTTLSEEDIPWPIGNLVQSARLAARRLGVSFEGVELATSNGTYRILPDGTVQRTRIIGDCILPVTELWINGFTDEPHDGEACKPPGV